MFEINQLRREVLLIIVLYQQYLSESVSIKSLTTCAKKFNIKLDLFIYDNSPIFFEQEDVGVIADYFEIKYVRDVSNPGISYAYNRGAEYANGLGKIKLLLLDQDTFFPENTLEEYQRAWANNTAKIVVPLLCSAHTFAFLSPSSYTCYFPRATKVFKLGYNSLKGKTLLNSGLLLSLDLFIQLKGYNEKIRLDFADTDFIERAKKNTKQFVVANVFCRHSLSAEEYNKAKALVRFDFYCSGAKEYIKGLMFIGKFLVFLWVFLRAVKLSLRFKDFSFLKKWRNELI